MFSTHILHLTTGFQLTAELVGLGWGRETRLSRFQEIKAKPELNTVPKTWFFHPSWRRHNARGGPMASGQPRLRLWCMVQLGLASYTQRRTPHSSPACRVQAMGIGRGNANLTAFLLLLWAPLSPEGLIIFCTLQL